MLDISPSKIVGVGRNYAAHARELGNEVPAEPLIFLKPPSAIVGDGDDVVHPAETADLQFEGELAVVIGRRCRRVSEAEALAHVAGYTCANDVTARDLQRSDDQWTRAKGFDTFCPLGPVIVADFDPSNASLTTRVNGEVRQQATTAEMVFSVPRLLSYISGVMTLEPGDVVLTGTPPGVGRVSPGDVMEVEIGGIGVLHNTVR
jgi:2-keto-4-pentenoate hydratase/2-oxohepta-3-ene-1,7-dioic acid hydratase in catechol pathway